MGWEPPPPLPPLIISLCVGFFFWLMEISDSVFIIIIFRCCRWYISFSGNGYIELYQYIRRNTWMMNKQFGSNQNCCFFILFWFLAIFSSNSIYPLEFCSKYLRLKGEMINFFPSSSSHHHKNWFCVCVCVRVVHTIFFNI